MTIITLIKQLDQLKVELDNHRPIAPDRYRKIMQKLQLDWNFHSNSIEGNTLTLTETKQLLYYGLTAKGKPLNDHKEMEGHAKVLKKMEEMVHQDLRLTESLIKEFHEMILMPNYDNSKEQDVEINPGHWKEQPNYLLTPTGEKLEFLAPEIVPEAMNELINWTNNHLEQNDLNRHSKKKYNLHPLQVACGFHKRFIDIHPFGDGNGRMARILMNLILMQQGYMPAIVYLEQRQDYYSALNTSTFEDISPLASYIGGNLMQSMQLAIDGAEGKPVEEQKDWMKELSVLGRQLKDRKKKQDYTNWSVEKQKAIRDLVLLPFVKEFKANLVSFEEIYDELKWIWTTEAVHILEFDDCGEISLNVNEPSYETIMPYDQLIRKLIRSKSRGVQQFRLMLSSKDEIASSFSIVFGFAFNEEQYNIAYVIGNNENVISKAIEPTYDIIISPEERTEFLQELIKNMVKYIKTINEIK